MNDLSSEGTWTNSDSGNSLKSSKGSGVKISSKIRSKLKNWYSGSHSFFLNGMWLYKIGDSSSRIAGIGIKISSKMLLKLGNKSRYWFKN